MSSETEEDVAQAIAAGMKAQLERVPSRAGWKVAFNVKAVQERLNLDGWLVGALPRATFLHTSEPWVLPAGGVPKIEAEIAVQMREDVPADVSPEAALAAIEFYAPAIELVDFGQPADSLQTMVSHSFFHAGARVGERHSHFTALGEAFPQVSRNGEVVRGPVEEQRLPDPTVVVRRASRILAAQGAGLRAGDWILCGSLIEPLPASPGDHFELDFGPLGRMQLTATAE